MYEDELIPLFENCGTIWDLRLMMDPMTGTNRGYAFVTFTNREAAVNAVRQVFKSTAHFPYPTDLPHTPRIARPAPEESHSPPTPLQCFYTYCC